MPFDDVTPQKTSSAHISEDAVMLAVYGEGGREVCIRIGANVMRRLGWSRGDRVRLAEGHGTDAGLVKLIRAPAGSYTLVKNGSGATDASAIRVGVARLRHHTGPRHPVPSVAVQFQAFGGEMLLMLPDFITPKQEA